MSSSEKPSMKFTLQDIVDGIESGSAEATIYLNPKTGETVYVSEMSMTEDEREAAIAEAGGDGNLIPLPHVESHEGYRWMEEFAGTVTDPRLGSLLAVALDGRGAFRRFKDVLAGFPSERERWFKFNRDKLIDFARDWVREKGLM